MAVDKGTMSSNPFSVAAERKAMYARRNQQQANGPWIGCGGGGFGGNGGGSYGGYNNMQQQQPQFGGGGRNFGDYGGTNGGGFARANNFQDRMTMMLADVIDCRADCSIPLNVDEDVCMITIALPRALYDEDIGIRLRKHGLFPVFLTTSGSLMVDHEKAWRISIVFGLNLPDDRFDQCLHGMQEL